MADESLRELQRALEESPDPTARLRYARELERHGDRETALAVLLAGKEDPRVREEVARYPGWTHPGGDPGHTNFLDVRPVLTEPKVKWIAEEPTGQLLSSPLAVVSHAPGQRITFIDPVSGETRASVPRRSRWDMPGAIVGQVYLTAQPDEEAFDLDSAKLLWKRKTDEHGTLSTNELLVRLTRKTNVLEASPRPDSLKAPKRRAWRWPKKGSLPEGVDGTVISIAAGAVVLGGSERFAVIDARTGAERFQGEGWSVLVDARGLVVHDDPSVVALDHDGRELWRRKTFTQVDALAPDFLIARQRKKQVVILDRAKGELVAKLPAGLVVLAIARDVIYAHEPERIFKGAAPRLSAFDATGRRIWRFEFAPRQGLGFQAAAPAPGRLLVALRSHLPGRTESFVVCFEG